MSEEHLDVAVIGGGLGGIYAGHRLSGLGLSVVGFERGSTFGGVWYHNGYPGARVDIDSVDYCFHFSSELYNKWRWEERFAAQPELLEYLNFVAEWCDVRRLFRFGTRVNGARWSSGDNRWHLRTDRDDAVACRYLVLCSGQLSEPRMPEFVGLERFSRRVVPIEQVARREVALAGRRIGIVGTGSTGVQAVPVLAEIADQLLVFQRTAHFTVPSRNGPTQPGLQDSIARELEAERERYYTQALVPRFTAPPEPLANFTPAEAQARIQRQWDAGGQGMGLVFSDMGTVRSTNEVVTSFIRDKIRATVKDPQTAERLLPWYPIGTHRIGLDQGFYESFNRDNVALVDVRSDPIIEVTETGVRTAADHYDVDLLILALGFRAFSGAMDGAGIRNEAGRTVGETWQWGPRTLLGLLVPGFPNLFTPTGAGSPSTLNRQFQQNEFQIDWIAECIEFLDDRGHTSIAASEAAADEWGRAASSYTRNMLRRMENDYTVHVNPDGTRLLYPFVGGMQNYVPKARPRVAANAYEGCILG